MLVAPVETEMNTDELQKLQLHRNCVFTLHGNT